MARAVASGVALGGAMIPVAILGDVPGLIPVGALVGALGGAPGAALEARARARGRRHALTAIACGLLLPLVVLLVGIQVTYAKGMRVGGLDAGLNRLGHLVTNTQRDPSLTIGCVAGLTLGLMLPLAQLVALRLKVPNMHVVRQVYINGIVVLVEAAVLGIGAAQAGGVRPSERPVLAGLVATAAIAAATLLGVGLLMSVLSPPALALADRFAAAPTPPAAPGSVG